MLAETSRAEKDDGLNIAQAKTSSMSALPNVQYVFAPDFLPDDRLYFVVGGSEVIALLQKLGRIRIGGEATSKDASGIDASASILVSTPRWPQEVDALLAAGISTDRIVVLLYYAPDPYAWWDFFRSLSGRFEATAPLGKQLTAFSSHLGRWANAKVAHDRLFTIKEYHIGHASPVVAEAAPRIHRVLSQLADGKSVENYARVIYGKPEDQFEAAVTNTGADQQYSEIVRLRPGDHVVNCGVGAGWELPYFIVMLQGQGRIYNVDPVIFDPLVNPDVLSSASGTLLKFRDLITDIIAAVSDVDGPKEYTFVNSMYYDLKDQVFPQDGNPITFTIDTSRIDSLVASGRIERIDYLKLDIEGSEPAALRGAIGSIKRFRPRVAVAIYHALSHFWDIPAYLMDELSDYDFYIRCYSYHRFETLLYAIPKEDRASRPLKNISAVRPGDVIPGKAAAHLVFHLQDDEDRSGYDIVRRNILTRFAGCDWPRAELSPGPNVSGLEVLLVVDRPADKLVVARPAGSDMISIGISREAGITWVHQTSLPRSTVGFAGYLEGRVVLPIQVEGSGKVALAEISGDGLHWLTEIPLGQGEVVGLWNAVPDAEPVLLVRDRDALYSRALGRYVVFREIRSLEEAARSIVAFWKLWTHRFRKYVLRLPSTPIAEYQLPPTVRVNLDADAVVLGFGIARPFGCAETSAQVALVVQPARAKPSIMVVADGSKGDLRNVGEIDLSEFRLVSTIPDNLGSPAKPAR